MSADPLYGLELDATSLMRVTSAEAQKVARAVVLIGNLAPALVGQGFYSATDMNGSAGSGRTANISVGKAIVGSAGNERYQKLTSIKNVAPSPDVDGTYYVYLTQQLDTDGSPLYTVSTSATPPTDTILAFTYVASGGTAGSFNNLPAGRVNLGPLALQSYVQSYAQGLDWKQSVRAATTANITLSGAQTIDGVSVVAGDRVLVKNQSTGSQNGLYVCAAGAWSRSTDADTDSEFTASTLVPVDEGTANGDSVWILTTNNPIVVGTTALTFAQFPGSGTYQIRSERNAASGYAPLDASSLLPRTNQTQGPDILYRNAGTPEGAVTATVGSVCYDTTNGRLYQKTSGSGNTGWSWIQLNSGVSSPAQITADQNDYALALTSKFFRLNTDASRNVTGFTNGVDGREIVVVNVGSFNLVVQNQNAGSTAANRIITGTGADITLAAEANLTLFYDATTARWRVLA